MATTRETMTGRMKPITNPETRAATRKAFLSAMWLLFLAVELHLGIMAGTWLKAFVRP